MMTFGDNCAQKCSFGLLLTAFVLLSHYAMTTDAASSNAKIPDKFLGTFKLGRSENFDEFLASKGINWFLRKMMGLASITKVFRISRTDPTRYDMENLSLKKDVFYNNWKLNETFRAEGFDGKIHEISFNYNPTGEVLTEKHVRIDNPEDKGETYSYTIENNELVLMMKNEKVTCKRFFTKQG